MDEAVFSIKPDEYEPDLFNDMSVQEEITVGSTEHVIGGNVDHDFVHNQHIQGSSMNMINSSVLSQPDVKSKPKLIYIKSGNNMGKHIRIPPNVRVIPLSKLNSETNAKVLQLGQPVRNLSNLGGNITRVMNPNVIRNGQIQVTRLNNFNLTKLQGGQKIIINKPGTYRNITPLLSLQNSGGAGFSGQGATIMQPMSGGMVQQQHPQIHQQQSQVGQTALKLEPGDSGFYNLTGGNGPTRYYPRMHSPDKDSLDGSQEMANVYKTNGLRKYARSVCDKVKEKGTTTYSEVADELVHEYAAEHPMIPAQQLHYIQKNIRRRVYDALNVLMALKVLEKEKKEIKWRGLPVNLLEECRQLEEEKSRKTEVLAQRVEELSELVLQLISYKNLVGRNRQRDKEAAVPQLNERIRLPFLVVSTNNSSIIDCNISTEKLEYMFTFDQPFEMQDEFQTLKQSGFTLRLGTSQCTESQYKRCLELVPNNLRFYVEAIYQQRPAIVPDFLSLHRRHNLSSRPSALTPGPSGSVGIGMSMNKSAATSTAAGLGPARKYWPGDPLSHKQQRFWTPDQRPGTSRQHLHHQQAQQSQQGFQSASHHDFEEEEDIEVMDDEYPSD